MRLALVLLVLSASACGPYSYVRKAGENPLAGQSVLMLDSLLFGQAQIDGMSEDIWQAAQNDEWRSEWPSEQAHASAAFAQALRGRLTTHGIKVTPRANPEGATLMLKPLVRELETGGMRPVVLVVAVQLCDVNGQPIEEISTKVKARAARFDDRLNQAALMAAENVSGWVTERAGK
jgi:hypothetical protein